MFLSPDLDTITSMLVFTFTYSLGLQRFIGFYNMPGLFNDISSYPPDKLYKSIKIKLSGQQILRYAIHYC